MMRVFCLGGISGPYQERWEAQSDNAFDIFTWHEDIPDLYGNAADEMLSDCFRADWGAWAYKTTKEKVIAYNRQVEEWRRIPGHVVSRLKDGETYAVVWAELY